MSINLIVKMRAKAGQGSAVADQVAQMLKDTRAFKGYQKINLYMVEDQPETLLLVEEWETAEDYDAYRNWRQDGGDGGDSVELMGLLAEPMEFMWLKDTGA